MSTPAAAPVAPPCPAHRATPATDTCRGCGRFLCDTCVAEARARDPEQGERCPACASTNHPIPWEDRGRGRVKAFVATLRALVGTGYFSTTPWSGGLRYPVVFAVICASLLAVGNFVFGLISFVLISDEHYAEGIRAFVGILSANAPPELADKYEELGETVVGAMPGFRRAMLRQKAIGVALAPIISLAHVMIMGALSHAVARALGGKGSYEATVRVLAYAHASVLLGLLPSVGGMLGFLGGLLLVTFAAKEAHGLSLGRSFVVAVWWIPLAAIFACVLFSFFVKAMFG